jgi:hypothetical protein
MFKSGPDLTCRCASCTVTPFALQPLPSSLLLKADRLTTNASTLTTRRRRSFASTITRPPLRSERLYVPTSNASRIHLLHAYPAHLPHVSQYRSPPMPHLSPSPSSPSPLSLSMQPSLAIPSTKTEVFSSVSSSRIHSLSLYRRSQSGGSRHHPAFEGEYP